MVIKKLIVEVVGTFFLMYVSAAAIIGQQPLAVLAMGATLMIAIYAGSAISGGHFNPIVSLAQWRRGKLALLELPQYVVAQLMAAALAAWLAHIVQDVNVTAYRIAVFDTMAMAKNRSPEIYSVLLSEFFPAFMLVFVTLRLTGGGKAAGNPCYGLIIGVTYAVCVIASVNVSGGLVNPALTVGLCELGLKNWIPNLLYLWIAQFAGGYLAAEVVHYLHREPEPPVDITEPKIEE